MDSITAVLQIYRRPDYFKEQLAAIDAQTIKPKKIFIVHNEGGIEFDIPEREDITYFHIIPNLKFHPRFSIGLLAQTGFVIFYDDDTIPGIRWHENVVKTVKKYNCVCGTNGRDVKPDLRQVCPAGWGMPNDFAVEVDFVGHSWGMKTEHLNYMWRDSVFEDKNGEDIMLSANAQIYGKIPTFVPPHPANDTSLWGSNREKAIKFGSDKEAHWIIKPTHFEERIKLIEYYRKKGWKLKFER